MTVTRHCRVEVVPRTSGALFSGAASREGGWEALQLSRLVLGLGGDWAARRLGGAEAKSAEAKRCQGRHGGFWLENAVAG